MDYNPFSAKVRANQELVQELEGQRADARATLSWAKRFNHKEKAAKLAQLRSDLDDLSIRQAQLQEQDMELGAAVYAFDSQTGALEQSARVGLNPFHALTHGHRQARSRLAEHKLEGVRLQTRRQAIEQERDRIADEEAALTAQMREIAQELSRYEGFQPGEARAKIAEISDKVAELERERHQNEARAAEIDRAVAAPLAELRAYQSELGECDCALDRLRSEKSQLERSIAKAKELKEELSRASSSRERAMVHQECESEFGNGKPGRVLSELEPQIRSVKDRIWQHEQTRTRIGRDAVKTEHRIRNVVERATRVIHSIIIDGNNCSYEGETFIGLRALVPMVEELAKAHDVTVVFDASIRRLLGARDGQIRDALPRATVHVVATGVQADETILDSAGPHDWVLSNDRFGDFRDKEVVREERVISHEILRGRVLVRDLGVNTSYAAG